MPEPNARYLPNFLADADAAFAELLRATPWRQDKIRIMGREIAQPRLTAWYGEAGATYTYSGLTLAPLPFTPLLARIRDAAEAIAGSGFNSVLLNHYRDGADGVSWHSDDEPELGPDPVIASVSLGATRRFDLRRRGDHGRRASFDLQHGSLLLMGRGCQIGWQHRIAKTRAPVGPRINLTFRQICGAGDQRRASRSCKA
ncbi:alpha-ketoglutarate-dependent dioxygenase AlkB family protein [Desertibaculum subflavum]|uniref:alpha-ketoglutarate-dependent dioxygenase AlkB family protein n=1 Tax=Desertibaculum subflavum TaxID=2268458 RepID=UPI000E66CD44